MASDPLQSNDLGLPRSSQAVAGPLLSAPNLYARCKDLPRSPYLFAEASTHLCFRRRSSTGRHPRVVAPMALSLGPAPSMAADEIRGLQGRSSSRRCDQHWPRAVASTMSPGLCHRMALV